MKIIFIIFFLTGFVHYVLGQSTKNLMVKDTGIIILADPINQTYLIRTKENKVYLPVVLTRNFMKDGMKIIFTGNIDTVRLKRTRLAGIPITIQKMKKQ